MEERQKIVQGGQKALGRKHSSGAAHDLDELPTNLIHMKETVNAPYEVLPRTRRLGFSKPRANANTSVIHGRQIPQVDRILGIFCSAHPPTFIALQLRYRYPSAFIFWLGVLQRQI
jgi:hypothetical protein